MGILKGASFLVVQKGQEVHQGFVLVMGADRDAKNLVVRRGLKAELPSVRPMVVVGGVST